MQLSLVLAFKARWFRYVRHSVSHLQ